MITKNRERRWHLNALSWKGKRLLNPNTQEAKCCSSAHTGPEEKTETWRRIPDPILNSNTEENILYLQGLDRPNMR